LPSPQDIIINALLDINRMGAGESAPNAEDNALALSHYNRIVDRWRALGRMSYFEFSQSFPWTVSKATGYTLGPTGSGADFIITGTGTAVRPPTINRAKLVLSGGYEIDLPIIFKREFQTWSLPSTESGQPLRIYYNPGFPVGTIYPLPYPVSLTDELKLYFGSQLETITMGGDTPTIAVNIDMPPALEDALTFTLAERLCTPFGKAVTQELKIQAHGARQVYSQLNDADPAFIGTALYGLECGPNYVTTYDGR
jgi:hypothetical protein